MVQRLTGLFRQDCQVIDVDGVRVQFSAGRGVVRAFNTQPVPVARYEAGTPAGLRETTGIMGRVLLAQPEVGPFEWDY